MTKKGWFRLISALVVVALMLVLIFQNLHSAKVEVLLWEPQMPLALLLIIIFLLGFVGGILTLAYMNAHRDSKK